LRHSDYLARRRCWAFAAGGWLVGHILPLCLPSAIVRLALDLAGIILRHSDYLARRRCWAFAAGGWLVGHILPLCLPSA
ncbi:hypothetical protein CJ738_35845, partial [Klebsiella pneumoniae]